MKNLFILQVGGGMAKTKYKDLDELIIKYYADHGIDYVLSKMKKPCAINSVAPRANKLGIKRNLAKKKGWTPTAIECYRIGGICRKCSLYGTEFQSSGRCRMKLTLIDLVKKYGRPED